MIATLIVPALAFILGVLLYFVSTNAKMQELGRALMWVGLLWTVYALLGARVKL
jgi:Na+/phosphate symporter